MLIRHLSFAFPLAISILVSTARPAQVGAQGVEGLWSSSAPANAPGARREYAAIYDSENRRYVIFGGYDYGLLNEVWSLTLGDTPTWSPVSTSGQSPGERDGSQWGYDPARNRLIIFGGYGQHLPFGELAYLSDVWELSLGNTPTWHEILPSGTPPAPRLAGAAIYDPLRQRLIGFGGTRGLPVDTWELDLSDAPAWSTVTTAGTTPPAGYGMTAIYDPVRDRLLMFGGSTSDDYFGVHNDVWELALSADPPVWTKLAAQGVAPALAVADTTSGTLPSPRRTLTSIYDPLRDRMVIFAGWDGQSNNLSSFLNDVWALSLSGDPVWTHLTPGGTGPIGRDAMAAVYDASADRLVVFGGWSGDAFLGDTWFLDWGGEGVAPSVIGSAQAAPYVARPRWTVQGATGNQAGVFRRETGTPWSYVATATRDLSGEAAYDDHAVVPGHHYAYQLVVPSQVGAVPGGEVWVDVLGTIGTPPADLTFALQAVRPNPLVGRFAVDFSLPDGSPARLDVLDLSGRRRQSVEVGGLGPGSHQVELGRAADYAPGLYFIRLSRGGEQITTRVVIGPGARSSDH
jgi:hypothetical protein